MNAPTNRGFPPPNPQGQLRLPKFDRAVLEPLDEMRKAMIDRERARLDLASARTPHEKATAVQRVDRATVRIARARTAVESALRAEAEAAA